MVSHVSFLGLSRLRKQLVDIFDIDQAPGPVVARTDAFEPGGLGWETAGAVEVAHGTFDAREFVDVVDSF